FDELLRAHVRDGRVNYRDIQSDERLTTYLRQLDRVDPNALPMREDRLPSGSTPTTSLRSKAFWIACPRRRSGAVTVTLSRATTGSAEGRSISTIWNGSC